MWLTDLLDELGRCPEYAKEEDIDILSEIALAKAKQFLEEVSCHVNDRPEIYPMEEEECCIAIDFRVSEKKSGILFVIEHDGSGKLFHRTENSSGILRVDDASDLLKEGGFLELDRVGIR